MGESISEAVILRWLKNDGDFVSADEPICEMETDKATFDLPAPASGTLSGLREVGATVHIGEVVAQIDEAAVAKKPTSAPTPKEPDSPPPAPTAAPSPPVEPPKPKQPPALKPSNAPSSRPPAPKPLVPTQAAVSQSPTKTAAPARAPASADKNHASNNGVRREPMSKLRRRIAERLVRAQHTAAMLTTFNEVDMSSVLALRSSHKEEFEKAHGVSLGLMSFFARATVIALKHHPAINAEIDGDDIVYHNHVHLAVAVNTDRGLVVPVLRNVEELSFGKFEFEIKRMATAAREGKLAIEELSGGTFTITNGGVFGSLLSTPILNPPQSGILGMHTIQKRPICVGDEIVARPMMYVALSYDHRLVDGRDAVQFLVKLKQLLEEPMSMLLET